MTTGCDHRIRWLREAYHALLNIAYLFIVLLLFRLVFYYLAYWTFEILLTILDIIFISFTLCRLWHLPIGLEKCHRRLTVLVEHFIMGCVHPSLGCL